MTTVRSAFGLWPHYNEQLSQVVRGLADHQVLLSPGPDRWPIWALVGHLACQRVYSFCDFAGEPGKESTPFQNAAFNCPGDDDLENVLGPAVLGDALRSTFAIIERCLDIWTVESLPDSIVKMSPTGDRQQRSRGELLQRSFAHDIAHIAELNEALGNLGLQQVALWD